MIIGDTISANLFRPNPNMYPRGYTHVAFTANKGVVVADTLLMSSPDGWMFTEILANTVPIGSVGVMRLNSQGI